ncbi:MAG: hypothetical protein U9Q97_10520, partial [Acidobacteriota bacterium]|nr:hypothetical protein [Acidobacteriota bacterium]
SAILLPWLGWSWMGGCGEIHTESGEAKCEIAIYRLCTLVRGLVTANDGCYVHPLNSLNQNNSRDAKIGARITTKKNMWGNRVFS